MESSKEEIPEKKENADVKLPPLRNLGMYLSLPLGGKDRLLWHYLKPENVCISNAAQTDEESSERYR